MLFASPLKVKGYDIQGRNLSDNWGEGGYSNIRVMPDRFLLK